MNISFLWDCRINMSFWSLADPHVPWLPLRDLEVSRFWRLLSITLAMRDRLDALPGCSADTDIDRILPAENWVLRDVDPSRTLIFQLTDQRTDQYFELSVACAFDFCRAWNKNCLYLDCSRPKTEVLPIVIK